MIKPQRCGGDHPRLPRRCVEPHERMPMRCYCEDCPASAWNLTISGMTLTPGSCWVMTCGPNPTRCVKHIGLPADINGTYRCNKTWLDHPSYGGPCVWWSDVIASGTLRVYDSPNQCAGAYTDIPIRFRAMVWHNTYASIIADPITVPNCGTLNDWAPYRAECSPYAECVLGGSCSGSNYYPSGSWPWEGGSHTMEIVA